MPMASAIVGQSIRASFAWAAWVCSRALIRRPLQFGTSRYALGESDGKRGHLRRRLSRTWQGILGRAELAAVLCLRTATSGPYDRREDSLWPQDRNACLP